MKISDGKLVSETSHSGKCYKFNDCDMANFEITKRDIGRIFFVARKKHDNDDSYFVYTAGLRGQRCTILDVDEESGTVTISKHSYDEVEINKNGISNDSISRGDSWDDFGCWASEPLPERVVRLIQVERMKIKMLRDEVYNMEVKRLKLHNEYLDFKLATLKKEKDELEFKNKIEKAIAEMSDDECTSMKESLEKIVVELSKD